MADNTTHHQSGTASAHPIADKFTGHTDTSSAESGNYTGFGTGRVPLASGLTGALDRDHAAGAASGLALGNAVPLGSHQHGSHGHEHHHGHHHGQAAGDAVSGAYAGGHATNALTGESHAHTTGAGVGPLAENLHGSTGTGTGATGLAAATGSGAAGAAGAGAAGYGTGVGPAGGAGGHYATDSANATSTSGATTAGLGGAAGVAGAGTAASGSAADKSTHSTKQSDFVAGAPVADPKDLDTGGKHSLVFDEKTGKYVHRHDL